MTNITDPRTIKTTAMSFKMASIISTNSSKFVSLTVEGSATFDPMLDDATKLKNVSILIKN